MTLGGEGRSDGIRRFPVFTGFQLRHFASLRLMPPELAVP